MLAKTRPTIDPPPGMWTTSLPTLRLAATIESSDASATPPASRSARSVAGAWLGGVGVRGGVLQQGQGSDSAGRERHRPRSINSGSSGRAIGLTTRLLSGTIKAAWLRPSRGRSRPDDSLPLEDPTRAPGRTRRGSAFDARRARARVGVELSDDRRLVRRRALRRRSIPFSHASPRRRRAAGRRCRRGPAYTCPSRMVGCRARQLAGRAHDVTRDRHRFRWCDRRSTAGGHPRSRTHARSAPEPKARAPVRPRPKVAVHGFTRHADAVGRRPCHVHRIARRLADVAERNRCRSPTRPCRRRPSCRWYASVVANTAQSSQSSSTTTWSRGTRVSSAGI